MGYLATTTIDIRPVLFTVCGTGVPWWVGPDADTARAVENQYLWQPIGYPAQPVPMGPSIANGITELGNQFDIHRAQVERNGAALDRLQNCQGIPGLIGVQQEWLRDLLQDYTGQSMRWMGAWRGLTRNVMEKATEKAADSIDQMQEQAGDTIQQAGEVMDQAGQQMDQAVQDTNNYVQETQH